MSDSLDILAIFAHPDDAELLCGGALAKSAERGHRVGILDLTAGEMGSQGTPELRNEEATRAAEILGVSVRRCAGLPDSGLLNTEEQRLPVIRHLREFRPRTVVTHWRVGRHRDHRVASEMVRDACFLSALRKLDAPGQPFRPSKLVYATAFREDAGPPSFVVDVSGQMDTKVEALMAYRSQFEGKTQAGEVYPGGDRPLMEQIRIQCAHYGSLIRAPFGEPFRVDETMEVNTLHDLGVASL